MAAASRQAGAGEIPKAQFRKSALLVEPALARVVKYPLGRPSGCPTLRTARSRLAQGCAGRDHPSPDKYQDGRGRVVRDCPGHCAGSQIASPTPHWLSVRSHRRGWCRKQESSDPNADSTYCTEQKSPGCRRQPSNYKETPPQWHVEVRVEWHTHLPILSNHSSAPTLRDRMWFLF